MALRVMTEAIARAAAMDAGNRVMRAAGRKAWSRADYNASVREFDRLAPLIQDEETRIRLGVDMPRKRNAPLKGARAIGANMTEVEHGDLTVLYSYETPVAFLSPKGGYVTDKRWSVTTSKHIAKFFDRHGYDRKGAFKVPQEDLEQFVQTGSLAGSEMGAGRVTRGNPRPRRTARRRGLIQDMQFFRQHGGGVVGEAARGALDLARAEREMERRNWYVLWEPDQDADLSWMSDEERAEEHEVYCAVLVGPSKHGFSTSDVLASLCGIVDPSREHKRVVEAELASEALARV